MTPFSYQRPERIDQAIALHGPDSRYIAGGTNLLDLMKENVLHPGQLIDINGLPLREIEQTAEGGLRIGALVSNADLAWHPQIEQRYPLLSKAILAGASPQLRNRPAPAVTCCSAPAATTSMTPPPRATSASRGPAAAHATDATASTPSSVPARRASPCIPRTCASRWRPWTRGCTSKGHMASGASTWWTFTACPATSRSWTTCSPRAS
jgi:CO/xanthine dehydrogenase FAD-binding subunit